MWNYLIGIIVKELIAAVVKAVADYRKIKEKKKEDKELVKNVFKEKCPKTRARNIKRLVR